MTPTQRTMAYFRQQGMLCGVVERWIPNPHHPGGGFRKDFLGIIDMIYMSQADGIVGVQSCGQDYAAHRRKILEEHNEDARAWLEAGGRLVLIGWRKVKVKRGGTAVRWEPRIEEFTLEDLDGTSAVPGTGG